MSMAGEVRSDVGAPGAPRGRLAQRKTDTDVSSAPFALAFEAMLQGARAMGRSAEITRTRTAPAQMFEPAAVDSRDARLERLQEDDRPSDATPTADRPQGEKPNSLLPEQTPVAHPRSSESRRDGLAVDRWSMASPRPMPLDRSMPDVQNAARSIQQPERAESSTDQAVNDRAAPAPELTAPLGNAPSSAAGTAVPTAPVARQVGEFLAASRPGETVIGKVATASVSPPVSHSERLSTPPKAPTTTTTEKAAPQANAPTPESEPTPFARLVRAIRLQVGERTSSARLQLHPPELGRMRVDVRLDGDRLALDVRTETQTARELIMQRVAELKTALAQQGIYVHRLEVAVVQSHVGQRSVKRETDEQSASGRRRGTDRGWLWKPAPLDVRA